MCLTNFESLINIVESIAVIVAIIIGGLWALKLFFTKREKYPKANLSNEITHLAIDNEKILLRVIVKLENQGDVLIILSSICIRILQINPWPHEFIAKIKKGEEVIAKDETEYSWPYIEEREINLKSISIEPNENEEIPFNFILDRETKSIQVYTFIENKMRKPLGWQLNKYYQIN